MISDTYKRVSLLEKPSETQPTYTYLQTINSHVIEHYLHRSIPREHLDPRMLTPISENTHIRITPHFSQIHPAMFKDIIHRSVLITDPRLNGKTKLTYNLPISEKTLKLSIQTSLPYMEGTFEPSTTQSLSIYMGNSPHQVQVAIFRTNLKNKNYHPHIDTKTNKQLLSFDKRKLIEKLTGLFDPSSRNITSSNYPQMRDKTELFDPSENHTPIRITNTHVEPAQPLKPENPPELSLTQPTFPYLDHSLEQPLPKLENIYPNISAQTTCYNHKPKIRKKMLYAFTRRPFIFQNRKLDDLYGTRKTITEDTHSNHGAPPLRLRRKMLNLQIILIKNWSFFAQATLPYLGKSLELSIILINPANLPGEIPRPLLATKGEINKSTIRSTSSLVTATTLQTNKLSFALYNVSLDKNNTIGPSMTKVQTKEKT